MAHYDRISDLPPDVIEGILSRLPIRDAARTSILSRTWRYRWNSMPDLKFKSGLCSSEEGLFRIVNRCLFLHRGRIRRFSVDGMFLLGPEIDMWISFLSRHGVQELKFTTGLEVSVPSSLFDCKNLTVLKLTNCKLIDIPPAFEGFVNLKRLYLNETVVDSSILHMLISRSPLLDSLSLEVSLRDPAQPVKINATRVKYLRLFPFQGISLEYLPALVEMDFGLDYRNFPSNPSNRSMINLFGAAPNIEKLTICRSDICFKYFKLINDPGESFMHLKYMELSPDLVDAEQVLDVLELLLSAPNLEKFVVSSGTCKRSSPIEVYSDFRRKYPLKRYCFMKLKVIDMLALYSVPAEVKIASFLLSNSPVLEEMKVTFLGRDGKAIQTRDTIMQLTRASAQAKIRFHCI